MFYGGNNHGSIEEVNGKWYIFYHRHTNGTNYSRQGCIEPIRFLEDGTIPQVEMTSCGCNGKPLEGKGEYQAYIACNLYCNTVSAYTAGPGDWMDCRFPKITQEGRDGDEEPGYIANMRDGATAGFKYFACENVRKIKVKVRGSEGTLQVRMSWDGACIGEIAVGHTNEWKEYEENIQVPDGVQALYFTYRGNGNMSFLSFELM